MSTCDIWYFLHVLWTKMGCRIWTQQPTLWTLIGYLHRAAIMLMQASNTNISGNISRCLNLQQLLAVLTTWQKNRNFSDVAKEVVGVPCKNRKSRHIPKLDHTLQAPGESIGDTEHGWTMFYRSLLYSRLTSHFALDRDVTKPVKIRQNPYPSDVDFMCKILQMQMQISRMIKISTSCQLIVTAIQLSYLKLKLQTNYQWMIKITVKRKMQLWIQPIAAIAKARHVWSASSSNALWCHDSEIAFEFDMIGF